MDERLLNHKLSQQASKLVNYFAKDTVEKILYHIDRLDIRDTNTLRNSIRAVVRKNAGGREALVTFFYTYYGDMVEQAVGRYRGVDADLPKGTGVKSKNIDIPPIDKKGYGPLRATFKGLPGGYHGKLREIYHRPRPFLRAEIYNQVDRITYRMLREQGDLIETHILSFVGEEIYNQVAEAMFAPFSVQGKTVPKMKVYFPDGVTQTL